MYYKIVAPCSFFTDLYDDIDALNIPYGAVFAAPQKPKYKPNSRKCLINECCFHFAEGAFDTLLWQMQLIYYKLDCQIYAIEPLTNVTKARCQDSLGIYQCGANQIKFLEKQDINNMYELAIEVYRKNPDKYTNFKVNIELWEKHQPADLGIYEDYCR